MSTGVLEIISDKLGELDKTNKIRVMDYYKGREFLEVEKTTALLSKETFFDEYSSRRELDFYKEIDSSEKIFDEKDNLSNETNIIQFPLNRPLDKYITSKSFHGVVDEIYDNFFKASLVDELNERYVVEIEKSKLHKEDLDLLNVGALFYWNIGKIIDAISQNQQNDSFIRFRRIPVWSEKKIRELNIEVDELSKGLLKETTNESKAG